MAKRIPAALVAVLFLVLIAQSAAAQPTKAPPSADTELSAQLKEATIRWISPAHSADVDLNAWLKEAQSDPKLAEALLKTGRKVATICANCHGEGGNSVKPDIPNLAGQNSAYLLEQLRLFAQGGRRNEFMEGMIKAMSADEKIGMVLFYATQKVAPRPTSKTALAAKGKEYFRKVCTPCHGENGRGNETIARIAGQQPDYLSVSLKRYRAGTDVRVNPLMAATTRSMSDADIDAVVAFVTSME